MGSLINVSICLSDIPKDKITEGKNGKKYCNVVIAERQNTDNYGKTHTVFMSQTKEEREAKTEKKYIGNAKEVVFGEQPKQNTPPPSNAYNGNDGQDLPF